MLAIGGSDSNAALFSFSFATVFLLTVLILFFYASRQEFYTFYSAAADQDQKENQSSVDFKTVLRSTWTFNLAVFLNFLVTLGVFPSYHSLAQTTSNNPTWQRQDIADMTVFTMIPCSGTLCQSAASWCSIFVTYWAACSPR